jgi:hypothetical protein
VPHIIRLARPWALKNWNGQRISVERRFHRPTALAADQRVDLVVRCQAGVRLVTAAINDCPLPVEETGSDPHWRHSVAPWLDPSNLIRLDFSVLSNESQPAAADETAVSARRAYNDAHLKPERFDLSPWAEVWLEIGENSSALDDSGTDPG